MTFFIFCDSFNVSTPVSPNILWIFRKLQSVNFKRNTLFQMFVLLLLTNNISKTLLRLSPELHLLFFYAYIMKVSK